MWGRRTPVPPAPAPFDASRGPTVLIGLQRGDEPEPHGTTASSPVPWAQRDGPFPRPPGATRAGTTQRGRPEADGAKGERQGGAPRPHGLRPRFPDPTRAGVAPTGRPEVGVAKGVGPSEPHGPTASTRVGAAPRGHPKAVVAKGVRPRERHGPTVSAPVPQAQRGPAPPRAPTPNPRWPGGGQAPHPQGFPPRPPGAPVVEPSRAAALRPSRPGGGEGIARERLGTTAFSPVFGARRGPALPGAAAPSPMWPGGGSKCERHSLKVSPPPPKPDGG